ncbi:MAG: monofunctional biosynthetic peptidoglycan transglycosylase [Gammaproteobacteria bacterium]|nr:monofunctional biosynthetic peptidoglycan transglycosylase [Gammaproteobacteria bacterium]
MRAAAKKRGWRRWLWRVPAVLLGGPLLLILVMRWLDPFASAFMLQRQVTLWLEGSRQWVSYEWVDWEYLGPVLPLAVVAAEDQRFPQHWGFDLEAIAKAWERNADGGRVRGASTISQQVAKNLFLWSGRSWLRKGLEAYLTLAIEVLWPKRRILEVYLNIAQFGGDVFGAGAASERFFGKIPVRITSHEAALLAAVLPNPVRYRADRPSAYVYQHAARIQQFMRQLGGDYLRNL